MTGPVIITAKIPCVHFWEVLPPTKSESAAVCRFCGESRVFSNRDTPPGDLPWRRFKVAEANPGREW